MDGIRTLVTFAAAAVVFARVRAYYPDPIWVALAAGAAIFWYLRSKVSGDFMAVIVGVAIVYIAFNFGGGLAGLGLGI